MAKRVGGLSTLLFLALSYLLDTEGLFPWLVCAMGIHELGHLLAILACGARLYRVEIAGFGLLLRVSGLLSYSRDAAIAAGGAAGNLLAAFCLSVAAKYCRPGDTLRILSGINLLMGLFHLLPALPLDGGRVIYALLARLLPPDQSETIIFALSMAIGSVLLVFGVYILVKTRYNISILAVCGLIFGGTYAQRSGNRPAKGAKARALCGRRVWTDQKRSEWN